MTDFVLHKNFAKKHKIAKMPMCDILLDDNANFPWLILVPRIPDLLEITDLDVSQKSQMWNEVEEMTLAMQNVFNPDKINIGLIGNITPQLHIHIVARYKDDLAWPAVVWGANVGVKEYSSQQIEQIKQDIYSPLFL